MIISCSMLHESAFNIETMTTATPTTAQNQVNFMLKNY